MNLLDFQPLLRISSLRINLRHQSTVLSRRANSPERPLRQDSCVAPSMLRGHSFNLILLSCNRKRRRVSLFALINDGDARLGGDLGVDTGRINFHVGHVQFLGSDFLNRQIHYFCLVVAPCSTPNLQKLDL